MHFPKRGIADFIFNVILNRKIIMRKIFFCKNCSKSDAAIRGIERTHSEKRPIMFGKLFNVVVNFQCLPFSRKIEKIVIDFYSEFFLRFKKKSCSPEK